MLAKVTTTFNRVVCLQGPLKNMLRRILIELKNWLRVASLRSQFSQIRLTLMVCLAGTMLALLAIYLFSFYFRIPLSHLTRDPATVSDMPFYIGLLSTLGIMLWSASAGVCCLGAFTSTYSSDTPNNVRFFLFSGLLSIMFTADDAFLLHEEVFPVYLNIQEVIVYLVYVLILSGYLLFSWRHILKTHYILFLMALLLWGLSIIIDLLIPIRNITVFIEDALKFSGIVFWFAYFFHATAMSLRASST